MAVAPPVDPTRPQPTAPTVLPYDPRTGAPSWYMDGGGTASSLDAFNQQQEIYKQYLNAAGVRDPVSGSNTQQTAIGQQPQFGYVDPATWGGSPFTAAPTSSGPPVSAGSTITPPIQLAGQTPTTQPATQPGTQPATQPGPPQTSAPPAPYQSMVPNLTKIDPNNDLRSQQINPTPSAQLSGLQSGAYNATQGLQGRSLGEFTPIAPGSYETGTDAKRARELAMQSLEGLSSGPDRLQLALNAFNRYREEREPQYQQDVRGVGQKAAAFGRIGAGMTTNELTDLATTKRRDEDRAQRSLIDDAVAQQLADRTMRLNAQLGAGGQFRGEDIAESGVQQGLRTEARGERADRQSQLLNQYGLDERGLDALLRTGNQFYGQEQGQREELRGERSWQDKLSNDDINRAIQQYELEQRRQQAEFDQWRDRENLRRDYGMTGTGASSSTAYLRP